MDLELKLGALFTEPKEFSVGDTIRVTVGLEYTVGKDTTVTLRACPYHYAAGFVLDRIGSCCGQNSVDLEAALIPTEKTATVDFYLLPAAEGGIEDGTYGLIVEVLEADTYAKLDDVLIISGNPAGIMDMLPMLMVVMMMGMMIPMMEGE